MAQNICLKWDTWVREYTHTTAAYFQWGLLRKMTLDILHHTMNLEPTSI